MQEFKLQGKEHVRLCDLLNLTHLCESGGVVKHVIASGLVKVNGKVELRKRAKIVQGQIVEYLGETLKII